MKADKDNYEFYRNTFNKVHASDELVRKVKNMTEVKTKNKRYTVRKVFAVAVVAAIIFAVSNVAVYATTGKSLVEKIAVCAIFNGEEKDIEVDKITDENGNVSYEIKLETEYDGEYQYPPITIDGKYGEIKKIEFITYKPTLIEENGKIYLVEDKWNVKEDITDDFADGKASVNVTTEKGNDLVVTVEGTIDSYDIESCPVESDERFAEDCVVE